MLCALVQAAYGGARADSTRAVSNVMQQWRTRQERIRTVECAWTEQYTRSGRGDVRLRLPGEREPKRPPVPEAGVTKEIGWTLVLDGNKVRHTSDGEKYSAITGVPAYQNSPYTAVFDGMRSVQHHGRGTGDRASQLSLGFIAEGYTERDNYHIQPILYHCRALVEDLTAFNQSEFRLVSQDEMLDGEACIVLRRSGAANPSVHTNFFVLPAKGFAVRRFELVVDDRVFVRVDSKVEQSTGGEWMPFEWRATVRNADGSFLEGAVARVKKYRINAEVPATEFSYEFPRETLVSDLITRRRYVVDRDGVRRAVTPAEENAASPDFLTYYRGLMAREAPRPRWWRGVLLTVPIPLIIAFLLLRVVRGRYARMRA